MRDRRKESEGIILHDIVERNLGDSRPRACVSGYGNDSKLIGV